MSVTREGEFYILKCIGSELVYIHRTNITKVIIDLISLYKNIDLTVTPNGLVKRKIGYIVFFDYACIDSEALVDTILDFVSIVFKYFVVDRQTDFEIKH